MIQDLTKRFDSLERTIGILIKNIPKQDGSRQAQKPQGAKKDQKAPDAANKASDNTAVKHSLNH
ncbi:MAG: hypothetical protein JAZ03_00380 [Candidatus Thiodiazotropha taylori]|nr:hypothetical protein [Candidatus Thiodiazotropha taylori]MCW4332386.1 hypothetical protein [Candidatus Thiodiazotropha endolucinida]